MSEALSETAAGDGRCIRWYPTVKGPAEPVELFGRLAGEGIRLRRTGGFLLAEVPAPVTHARRWPALDRLLRRLAASLALTASLAQRFAQRHPPHLVSALLEKLRREVPEILLETVGGGERLRDLTRSPPAGADYDLACIACCRGLAIRAIHQGRSLAGLFVEGEGDGQDRGRGHGVAEAAQGRRRGGRDIEAGRDGR